MKTAFAHWDDRIAPVFDTAQQIHLVEAETEPGRIIAESEELLTEDLPVQKAMRLVEWGVSTLVCGAISNPMHGVISAYGIQVVPFVAGDLREVIQAWLLGKLDNNAFVMPGCCGRRRCRGMRGPHEEELLMRDNQPGGPGQGRGGQGQGGGRGQGRGQGRGKGRGQGQGRMGGARAGSMAGYCLCPDCGHREPHKRGEPCVERKCPQCGAAMTRE
ncbi:MAG: hypothetical protein HPY51_17000 [Candidatus Omnitrophica bacterium]|nr:hypothetical protein [Candidatus Omnitrophota bacterium]